MKIKINKKKAKIVFDLALSALKSKRYPFENILTPGEAVTLPETLETGTPVHGRFLFLACLYMRGGIKSDQAFTALAQFFKAFPEFFSVTFFNEKESEKRLLLETSLRENSLAYHAGWVASSWIHNLRKLEAYWENDPAKLFDGVKKYEEVCKRLMYPSPDKKTLENPYGFCGFREKMVSMLLYFLMLNGLVEEFIFPVPVDIQVLRLLLSNRLLVAHDSNGREITEGILNPELLRPHGRKLTYEYCRDEGVSPLRLSDALWWLGRTACPKNPGNRTKVVGERNGRKTIIEKAELIWNKSQAKSFEQSCLHCPLRGTCELNVPGRINSIHGNVELWGFRKESPQRSIFSLG